MWSSQRMPLLIDWPTSESQKEERTAKSIKRWSTQCIKRYTTSFSVTYCLNNTQFKGFVADRTVYFVNGVARIFGTHQTWIRLCLGWVKVKFEHNAIVLRQLHVSNKVGGQIVRGRLNQCGCCGFDVCVWFWQIRKDASHPVAASLTKHFKAGE